MFKPEYNLFTYQYQLSTNYQLASNYQSQIKGDNPQPVIKTGNHMDTILLSIKATTSVQDLVSYRYQSEAHNYRSQTKGDDRQPVIKIGNDYSLAVNSMEFLND